MAEITAQPRAGDFDDWLPDELMHEDEVYKKYPSLFAYRELLEARRTGQIRWFRLRKGPHYSVQQIKEYLKSKECQICPSNPLIEEPEDEPARESSNGSSNTIGIGSGTRKDPIPSTSTGTTRKLVELAASRLEQEI